MTLEMDNLFFDFFSKVSFNRRKKLEILIRRDGSPVTVLVHRNAARDLQKCLNMIFSQVEGEPKPDIYWKRGNKILVNDEHYQISSKGKMTIQNTVREDDGDYYCFGRNEIAENKAGIRLTIQGMYLITGDSPDSLQRHLLLNWVSFD